MSSSILFGAEEDFDGDGVNLPAQLEPLSPYRDDGTNRVSSFFDPTADGATEVPREQGTANGTRVKVERRVRARQTRPTLNPARLIGPRGIPALKKIFEKVKFKGRGHEVDDLNKLVLTMEHWGHRLFPAMNFDELITKCELLGSKKPVHNFMHGMRQIGDFQEAPDDNTSVERRGNSADLQDICEMVDEDVEGETNLILDRAAPVTSDVSQIPSVDRISTQISNVDSLDSVGTDSGECGLTNITPACEAVDDPLLPKTPTNLTPEQLERIENNRRKAHERRQSRHACSQMKTIGNVATTIDTSAMEIGSSEETGSKEDSCSR